MNTQRHKAQNLATLVLSGVLFAVAAPLAGSPVLVLVVTRVHGQADALWETEIRITNGTDTAKQFRVVDWIGTEGWKASAYVVAPNATTAIGGYDAFGAFVPLATGAAGLAICEADEGLIVQNALLSGIWSGGGGVSYSCPPYDGGSRYAACLGWVGAGPILEGLGFSGPGKEVHVPWLHTEPSRRTNLVLINPDDVGANAVVSIRSQDGATVVTETIWLAPRSYNQLSDLFGQVPWSDVRVANRNMMGEGAGASATISSNTRLLAIGLVISKYNNSLTVSVPR